MYQLSDEEALKLFMKLREKAIEHVHHRLPLYLHSLDYPKEALLWLSKDWRARDWTEVDIRQSGNGELGNIKLVDRWLAYAPGEERVMDNDERDCLIEAALLSLASNNRTVLVNEFVKLTPKVGLYKLVDAKIVNKQVGYGSRHVYVLEDTIPGLG